MTLLVLDLHVEPGLDKDEFIDAVRRALPDLGAYALSFTILAGFWRDHRERAGGTEGELSAKGTVPSPYGRTGLAVSSRPGDDGETRPCGAGTGPSLERHTPTAFSSHI